MDFVRIRHRVNDVTDFDIIPVNDLDDDVVAFILHRELAQMVAQLTIDDGLVTEALNVGHDELQTIAILLQGDVLRTDTERDDRLAVQIVAVDLGDLLVRYRNGVVVGERHEDLVIFSLQFDVEEVHLRCTDEAGNELVVRLIVQVHGRIDLLDVAELHDDDTGAHGHRFDLVMGNIDEGRLQALVQRRDLGTHGGTQLSVQVGQRLVEQEDLRVTNQRTAQRDTLSLAAAHFLGLTLKIILDVQHLGRLHDPLFDLFFGHFTVSQAKRHVLVHRHMRVQRIALEHHSNITILRLHVVDQRVTDEHVACRDRLQSGNHTQCGRFAAAGRSDKNNEFPVRNVDGEIVHSFVTVIIDFVDVGKL